MPRVSQYAHQDGSDATNQQLAYALNHELFDVVLEQNVNLYSTTDFSRGVDSPVLEKFDGLRARCYEVDPRGGYSKQPDMAGGMQRLISGNPLFLACLQMISKTTGLHEETIFVACWPTAASSTTLQAQ